MNSLKDRLVKIIAKREEQKQLYKKQYLEIIKQNKRLLSASIESSIKVLNEFSKLYINTNEELVQNVYEKILKKGSCIIDVGAHIARHLKEFIRISNGGKIIAFEPIPNLAHDLNVKYSSGNIKIINAALSDKAGIAEFYVYKNSLAESSLNKREERMKSKGDYDAIQVDVHILDEYINEFEQLDFIKIDAESAEMNILIGAKEIINKFKPIVTVELGSEISYFGYTKTDFYNLINDYGYHIYDVFGNKFESLEAWNNYNATFDFVLVPIEKSTEFEKYMKEGDFLWI